MANTLTSLVPDAYAALDVVSRELTGLILAVARDSKADMIPVGQTLRAFQTAANTAGKDITAAMAIPAAADQTVANKSVTISKARSFPFSWNGEQAASVNVQGGPGFLSIRQDQIAQAIRAAVNEIELGLWQTMYPAASRAYGTAGTAPFGSTLADPAQIRKILDDNGAPASDRHLVFDTTAGANMRTLAQLTKVNEAGDNTLLRQGTLLNIHNFNCRESGQISAITAGTATSATTDNAGYAVGATTLTLASAGTGTILAGDIVTFAGDTNKYVITTGDSDVSNGGTIVLAQPGLKVAMSTATKAITVTAASTRNLGFSRNAAILATRLPYVPPEGDLAILREVLTDERTGLSFSMAVFPGYHMVNYEIQAAWGYSVIKPEHMAVLLG